MGKIRDIWLGIGVGGLPENLTIHDTAVLRRKESMEYTHTLRVHDCLNDFESMHIAPIE